MSLIKADGLVRNASAVRVVRDSLLTDHFANNQQRLVPVPTGRKKACPTTDQGVDAGQIALQVARLLLDGHTDPVDSRLLLLGHSQKLPPGFIAMCTGLIANSISNLQIHRINQSLGDLSFIIETRSSLRRNRSVGCRILTRVHVGSIISEPWLVDPLDASLRRTIHPLQSLNSDSGIRLRNQTIIDGSNVAED